MRSVAFVIDELEVGGTQRQLYLTALGLAARGWTVDVICLLPITAMEAEFRDAGIAVHFFLKKRQIDLRLIAALRRFFAQRQTDIVHAFSSTAEFYAGVAAWLAGARFVGSIRNAADPLPPLHRLGKRAAERLADAVIANTRAGREDAVARRLAPGDRVHVVPNGVDMKRFVRDDKRRAVARGTLGIAAGRPVIASVGRLTTQKAWDTILRIARDVTANRPDALFIAAGDGPLRDRVDADAAAYGLGKSFIRLGECRDVSWVLAAADIYLHASRWEGMSNSIMEAMAAALPVVATAVGGTPEIVIDGRTGLLFPVDDVAAGTARVCQLMADPNLRQALGRRGCALIERNHGAEVMVSSVHQIYQTLVPHAAAPFRDLAPRPSSGVTVRER